MCSETGKPAARRPKGDTNLFRFVDGRSMAPLTAPTDMTTIVAKDHVSCTISRQRRFYRVKTLPGIARPKDQRDDTSPDPHLKDRHK